MKTYAFLALTCVTAALACGCGSESLCERVECGSGGGTASTEASGSTETGAGSTESTSASQPTSSGSSGGGDGGASGSSSSSDSGGGAGGGGEGGGGAPPGCELEDGEPVTGLDCAIFVDGTYEGDQAGTRDRPYTTIAQAVAAISDSKPIYVCSGATYTETIEITDSMRIVGGFGCETWTWADTGRTEWTAEADEIPLRVTTGANVAIANFDIAAQNASDDIAGGSSIGILVADSAIEFARCDVRAGDGSAGNAQSQEARANQAPPGNSGNDGCAMDDTGANVPGGQNSCGGSPRHGGSSGFGTNEKAEGDGGSSGLPLPPNGGVPADWPRAKRLASMAETGTTVETVSRTERTVSVPQPQAHSRQAASSPPAAALPPQARMDPVVEAEAEHISAATAISAPLAAAAARAAAEVIPVLPAEGEGRALPSPC